MALVMGQDTDTEKRKIITDVNDRKVKEEDPRIRKTIKENARIERDAKEEARKSRKAKKVLARSSILNRYKDSEFVVDNYGDLTLSKQFMLAKKWEQKTKIEAKKAAKDKLQIASIAKFRAEADTLGVTVPDKIFTGSKDKQERNIWQFIKKFHSTEIGNYKTANKAYRSTLKAYKKSVKDIKSNNIDAVRAGKTLGRKMRNVKQEQKKELKGSAEYNALQTKYENFRNQKAEVLAKVSESKKDVPEPVKPVVRKFEWQPRPRKGTRNDHSGKDRTDEFLKKQEKKDEEREKKNKNKKKD